MYIKSSTKVKVSLSLSVFANLPSSAFSRDDQPLLPPHTKPLSTDSTKCHRTMFLLGRFHQGQAIPREGGQHLQNSATSISVGGRTDSHTNPIKLWLQKLSEITLWMIIFKVYLHLGAAPRPCNPLQTPTQG